MAVQADSPLFTRKQLTRLIWPLLAHSLVMILWPAAFRIGGAYLFVMPLRKTVLWVWYAMFIDWVFRVIVFCAAFRKPCPEINKGATTS